MILEEGRGWGGNDLNKISLKIYVEVLTDAPKFQIASHLDFNVIQTPIGLCIICNFQHILQGVPYLEQS